MEINLKNNFPQVQRWLSDTQKNQVPFATMLALNATARKVLDAEVKEMQRVFDRPTTYTLRGFRVYAATKQRLTARVWFRGGSGTLNEARQGAGAEDDAYLLSQIRGGKRLIKPMEKRLHDIGVLPRGWYAVPGEGATLDSHGNMSRGQISLILNYLGSYTESGYNKIDAKGRAKLAKGSKTKRGVAFFVSRGPGSTVGNAGSWRNGEKRQHLPAGVWARYSFGIGTAIKPVLLFVRDVGYRKRFDFYNVGQRAVQRHFAAEFDKAFARAMKTARPAGPA